MWRSFTKVAAARRHIFNGVASADSSLTQRLSQGAPLLTTTNIHNNNSSTFTHPVYQTASFDQIAHAKSRAADIPYNKIVDEKPNKKEIKWSGSPLLMFNGLQIVNSPGIEGNFKYGWRSVHNIADQREGLHKAAAETGVDAANGRKFSTIAEDGKSSSPVPLGLRPLSPHLPIYKPQSSSTYSIFHRISGAYLVTFVLFYYLLYMKIGLTCFTYQPVYEVFYYSSKLFLISAEIAALALAYHAVHGVRHLLHDISGIGPKTGQ